VNRNRTGSLRMPDSVQPRISINELGTGYGKKQVLNGVSVEVAGGEIVALIGHNGAGKSTLLKAVFGLLRIWHGHVFLDGQEMSTADPRSVIRAGVSYMPQGNRVFADLTVRETWRWAASLYRTRSDSRRE